MWYLQGPAFGPASRFQHSVQANRSASRCAFQMGHESNRGNMDGKLPRSQMAGRVRRSLALPNSVFRKSKRARVYGKERPPLRHRRARVSTKPKAALGGAPEQALSKGTQTAHTMGGIDLFAHEELECPQHGGGRKERLQVSTKQQREIVAMT